jgi:branched-subunit amino acid aminotransferase/4-amino-4-deoxychorismate lyase
MSRGVKMSEFLNRAFMYGESVFTTMRMIEGEIQDWDEHFKRLEQGAKFVFGPFIEEENWAILLKNRIEQQLLTQEGQKILRITLFREQERGLKFFSSQSIKTLKISLNSAPLYDSIESHVFKLKTFRVHPRPDWWPSFLKAGSYLESILAQKHFLQDHEDDLLFLNPQNEILETTIANVFIVKNNCLYTPALGPNVLDGIMRNKVIERGVDLFDEIHETPIPLDQLLAAEVVFGCNSVRGPFLIGRVDQQQFFQSQDFLDKFDVLKKRVFK